MHFYQSLQERLRMSIQIESFRPDSTRLGQILSQPLNEKERGQ